MVECSACVVSHSFPRLFLQEIGSLRNLKFLEVSENQLMFLPLSIAGLGSLQDLHLSDNLLTLLPDTMGELSPPLCVWGGGVWVCGCVGVNQFDSITFLQGN